MSTLQYGMNRDDWIKEWCHSPYPSVNSDFSKTVSLAKRSPIFFTFVFPRAALKNHKLGGL